MAAPASANARSVKASGSTRNALPSVASAQSSVRARAAPPHYLGGSNNLVSERSRREKAESALQKTKLSLHTVAGELVPQIEQLSTAIKTIQIEKHFQLNLDEASQEVLEALQQQLDELETRQNSFPDVVEERLEALMQQLSEQRAMYAGCSEFLTAVQCAKRMCMDECPQELELLVAHVQDSQDDLNAELQNLRACVQQIEAERAGERARDQRPRSGNNNL